VLLATKVALLDPPIVEGAGDFFPIMLRVVGPDFEVLKAEAERVRGLLASLAGTADVRVDLNPPKPELQVQIDRTRAHDLDVTAASLAMQLRLAMNGQEAGKLREGEDETPIVVRLSEADRASPEAVRRLDVFSSRGVRPVADVASVALKDGPSVIERHNRQRQVTVMANIAQGGALGAVVDDLKVRLKAAPLPPGYDVVFDGQMKLMQEQNDAFALVFVLAFAFVYMVLASQFESFKHPITIVVSVPLALIGALLGLVLTGHNLSLGAMIGLILLMGLVTKNAILLVDGALQNLRAGDDLNTALLKAGPRRLRPILMTSAAMAIGMVPTAIGTGLGSEFRAPMAVSVIGGVITSTFLTLIVVPVVFSFMERLTPKALRVRKDVVGDELDADAKGDAASS
jgi:HAE1 family hydrophobic/amphiphilic exporter-1